MKAALLVAMIAVTTLLCAQTPGTIVPESPTNPWELTNGQAAEPRIAAGATSEATLAAELTRGVDARKVGPGDTVVAKCTQILTVGGEVVIPKNTKIVGHIVQAQTRGRGRSDSILAITFDTAVLRDGRVVPLTATLQALAPPAIMAAEAADPRFDSPIAPEAKPKSAGLLPGALKHVPPATMAPALDSNTTGIIGLKGLQLETPSASASRISVIHSDSQNVRLESGTRLILRISLQ